ncbi:Pantothenate transporter liz1 [Apiospora arundinis]
MGLDLDQSRQAGSVAGPALKTQVASESAVGNHNAHVRRDIINLIFDVLVERCPSRNQGGASNINTIDE